MFGKFVFGFCFWDIVACLALIVVLIMLILQQKKHKEKMNNMPTDTAMKQ